MDKLFYGVLVIGLVVVGVMVVMMVNINMLMKFGFGDDVVMI